MYLSYCSDVVRRGGQRVASRAAGFGPGAAASCRVGGRSYQGHWGSATLLSSRCAWARSGAATSSRQQAADRRSSIAISGGDSARQWSSANGQRLLKRQPTVLVGTLPAFLALPASRSSIGAPRRSGSGAAASSNCV